jgi:hypothetical protein
MPLPASSWLAQQRRRTAATASVLHNTLLHDPHLSKQQPQQGKFSVKIRQEELGQNGLHSL